MSQRVKYLHWKRQSIICYEDFFNYVKWNNFAVEMESTLTLIICLAEPLNLLITVILPQCSYRHTHCYMHAHVCVWVSGRQWRIRVCNEYWPKEDRLHWVIWLQKREGRLIAREIETKRDTLTDSHFSEPCTVVWVYSSRWLINYAQHIDTYVWFRFGAFRHWLS
jgi:hypothetical protein